MMPQFGASITVITDDTGYKAGAGSVKANGRELITCLGRVFNYKLGCFDNEHAYIYVDKHPHLELKNRPRFSPVS